MPVVCDVLVHDSPQSFNGIEVRTVWGKLDQVDPTLRSCKKFPNIWAFVVGCVVPDHMYEAFVGVTGLDLSQELHCADTIHCGWLDKGHIESLHVQCPMDVDPPTPRGRMDCGF